MEGAPEHPTIRLWKGLDPEVGQRAAVPIICGVPMTIMDDVLHIALARSRPAARLLQRTPDIMRHLSHQTTVKTERCVGHVRGPIQWSETITAWSSGIGVDDVFICSSPRRDFDVPENRLLVWLLKRVANAGRRTGGDAARWFSPDEIARVQELSRTAAKLLSHPSLRGIPISKPTGRELRLIRKGRHLSTYAPAIKLSERVATPFTAMDARALVSEDTTEHHRVIMMLLDAVRAHGHAVPLVNVRGDYVVSGHLRYRNTSVMVDRRESSTNGLYFGDVRVLTRVDAPATPTDGPTVRVESGSQATELVARVLGQPRRLTGAATPREPLGHDQSASGLVQLPGSYSS